MRITVITAFPELFRGFLSASIIGRALKAGLFEVDVLDLRTFGRGGYRQIDDYAFGAGGMVLMAQPLTEALEAIAGKDRPFVVYPTPQGMPLTQETVETLALQRHVVIVCGHYEGIDERFVEQKVDLEVTVGDFVLTGGELPAMMVIDAVARMIPGVVGNGDAVVEDSFYRGMLDHPHYTRPPLWEGRDVPEILLSGNASEIEKWRRSQAVVRTLSRRPELLYKAGIGSYTGKGFYAAIDCDIPDFFDPMQASDLAFICDAYGILRLFCIVSDPGDRESFRAGLKRLDAEKAARIKLMPSFGRMMDWVREKEGDLLLIEVSSEIQEGMLHWFDVKRLLLQKASAVVFCFSGSERSKGATTNFFATAIPFFHEEKALPLCGQMAVTFDRFLGSK